MPKKKTRQIDKVRASREGHEYHEAWAARRALQLLLPQDNLVGIAVEGLSPTDQTTASSNTVEIADLTLYYGTKATFSKAERIEIVQFKFSEGKKDKPFSATDADKTLKKFAKAFKEEIKKNGLSTVKKKVFFELITNQSISGNFIEAMQALIDDKEPKNAKAKVQAKTIKKACQLKKEQLHIFLPKVKLSGASGSLGD